MKWLWYLLLLALSVVASGLMIESLTGQPVIAGLSFGDAINNISNAIGEFLHYLGL